ncbi:hypothetical protein Ade02nite_04850 [Paractinoplanes deccanensis]|uniref:Uncharacterized protein n=1 Tax=Paractinoplanes deccanensis TaxID=113561 RepID=A0ABQ3XVS3_9ACTN|nr:hypothetical protein Ade02nite_04850 [Actinoplanes deccanensis]
MKESDAVACPSRFCERNSNTAAKAITSTAMMKTASVVSTSIPRTLSTASIAQGCYLRHRLGTLTDVDATTRNPASVATLRVHASGFGLTLLVRGGLSPKLRPVTK